MVRPKFPSSRPPAAQRPLPTQLETLRHVDEHVAAALLGLSVQTLRNWRALGKGIAYSRPNNRSVRYRLQDLLDHIDTHRVVPADQDGDGKEVSR